MSNEIDLEILQSLSTEISILSKSTGVSIELITAVVYT